MLSLYSQIWDKTTGLDLSILIDFSLIEHENALKETLFRVNNANLNARITQLSIALKMSGNPTSMKPDDLKAHETKL